METFVRVIKAGSFSAGAGRMNVGQPAVSNSIAELESTLGVRLFVPSTRGLTPTEAASGSMNGRRPRSTRPTTPKSTC